MNIPFDGRGVFSNSITIYFHADLAKFVEGRGFSVIYDGREALLEPHKLVFRKVPGAAGRDAAGAFKQAGAKIGVRCAPCDVAIGAHQPQTDGDVGNGIVSDLLECRI